MMSNQLICCLKNVWKIRPFWCFLTSQVKKIILCILFCGLKDLQAQTNQIDTVGIIETIVEEQDTMIRYPVPVSLSRKWTSLQEKPIDSLLFRQNSTRFKKELYNLLIKSGSRDASNLRYPITNSNMAALDGKIIRQIEFKDVDIFAPAVTDTIYQPSSRFEKAVNNTHKGTRRKILERYLLLKQGNPLDVFLAAENERILRDLSFIMDARFIARQIPGSPDSVDLLLLTQDKLPIGLQAEMIKSTLAVLGISHQNVLGFGHQFTATSYWDSKNSPNLGYGLSYSVANLAGTFATGKMEYTHRWNQESYVFDISRDFRTSSFRNAGGVMFENTTMQKNIELLDTTLFDVNLKYTNTDLWGGRMLQLNKHTSKMSSGLFLTGRFNMYENYNGPVSSDDYLYAYQDKTLLLFSTGFTRQGFRKDNLIYSFGKTEDVPFGYLIDITAGAEWGQYNTRPYLSTGTAYGTYIKNAGYFFGQVKFGTFFENGLMEQGAFRVQLRYFSDLHSHNRFRYRSFINLTYLRGINRFIGEYTGVENFGGISGLTGHTMRGRDKLVLNLESVVFSPFVFLGFRFAFFGSVDIGLVNLGTSRMVDSRGFSGFGAGVRIRNDRLVFDTFVFKFAIYPGKPENGIARNFIADSVPRFKFDHFFPTKPTIIDYQ